MKRADAPAAAPALWRASKPAGVNLLPSAVHIAQVARSRTRKWGIAFATAAVLLCVGWMGAIVHTTELQQVQTALMHELSASRQATKEVAALAARMEVLRKQQLLLDTMRRDHSWSSDVFALARCVPQHVVLTRVTVAPPGRRAEGEDQAPGASDRVQVDGVAADHAVLAAFIQGLQQAGTFRHVQLIHSTLVAQGGPEGCLNFSVACRR